MQFVNTGMRVQGLAQSVQANTAIGHGLLNVGDATQETLRQMIVANVGEQIDCPKPILKMKSMEPISQ